MEEDGGGGRGGGYIFFLRLFVALHLLLHLLRDFLLALDAAALFDAFHFLLFLQKAVLDTGHVLVRLEHFCKKIGRAVVRDVVFLQLLPGKLHCGDGLVVEKDLPFQVILGLKLDRFFGAHYAEIFRERQTVSFEAFGRFK
jgi:hypothetical protein